MLKKIFLSLGIASLMLFVASPVLAAEDFGLDKSRSSAGYGETNIYSTLSTVISTVLVVIGVVFLTIMVYAGLRWMTARGNEAFIDKAKDAMFGAVMGLILVSVSYALSAFIFNRLIK